MKVEQALIDDAIEVSQYGGAPSCFMCMKWRRKESGRYLQCDVRKRTQLVMVGADWDDVEKAQRRAEACKHYDAEVAA